MLRSLFAFIAVVLGISALAADLASAALTAAQTVTVVVA